MVVVVPDDDAEDEAAEERVQRAGGEEPGRAAFRRKPRQAARCRLARQGQTESASPAWLTRDGRDLQRPVEIICVRGGT